MSSTPLQHKQAAAEPDPDSRISQVDQGTTATTTALKSAKHQPAATHGAVTRPNVGEFVTLRADAVNAPTRPPLEQAVEMLRGASVSDDPGNAAANGRSGKDKAHRFWQTQPVPGLEETGQAVQDGPLTVETVVTKERQPLIPGFEWVNVDVADDDEAKDLCALLDGHYVEDHKGVFRFNYSVEVLRWIMTAPGWQQKYHIGVRASQSRKLVAFISATPAKIRVRNASFVTSQVNLLCVHKKLRGKRLAPVLIKEVSRISLLANIWQGVYTASILLPRPVSTCRYYHRVINWPKMHGCGFVPLPTGSTPQYETRRFALPSATATPGLREMRTEDVHAVLDLLARYLARFQIAPEFTAEQAKHWFTPSKASTQAVWSYVVENSNKEITDFFSFFCIEVAVTGTNNVLRVAHLFYYATEAGLSKPVDVSALKVRTNALINDALVLARDAKMDMFNALSLMDNALFLDDQLFQPGDAQLHYYLFNYRTGDIASGMAGDRLDKENLSGIGLILP